MWPHYNMTCVLYIYTYKITEIIAVELNKRLSTLSSAFVSGFFNHSLPNQSTAKQETAGNCETLLPLKNDLHMVTLSFFHFHATKICAVFVDSKPFETFFPRMENPQMFTVTFTTGSMEATGFHPRLRAFPRDKSSTRRCSHAHS